MGMMGMMQAITILYCQAIVPGTFHLVDLLLW